jgi:hypothetical protein
MIRVKRINAEDVAPVKFIDDVKDKRPVKGRDIFPEIYSNIFFCARKKSGKTCAIAHIIDKCSTSETKVIAFVSTLHRDPTWAAIQDMCEKKKIDFTGYTSLFDEKTKDNILTSIVDSLQAESDAKKDKKEEPQRGGGLLFGDDTIPRERKSKKPKENACKIIFVLDDLSGEIKDPVVARLLKKNRHFKCKVLLSSQYFNDIELQGRMNLNYVLLYKGLEQSLKKLQEIYNNLNISVPFNKFIDVYKYCTKEPYHFMYIDVENSEFRLDFTHKIDIPKEDEEREL